MKNTPLQKVEAGCGSLGYRVERTPARSCIR
jgi:hypothetical protein